MLRQPLRPARLPSDRRVRPRRADPEERDLRPGQPVGGLPGRPAVLRGLLGQQARKSRPPQNPRHAASIRRCGGVQRVVLSPRGRFSGANAGVCRTTGQEARWWWWRRAARPPATSRASRSTCRPTSRTPSSYSDTARPGTRAPARATKQTKGHPCQQHTDPRVLPTPPGVSSAILPLCFRPPSRPADSTSVGVSPSGPD